MKLVLKIAAGVILAAVLLLVGAGWIIHEANSQPNVVLQCEHTPPPNASADDLKKAGCKYVRP